jgi:lysophospholipase L1-like esterase
MIAVSVALPAWASAQDSSPIDIGKYNEPIKLACVGDSITAGVGAAKRQSWPDQIRGMLGEKWNVRNFGVSAKTLMNSGDDPYQKHSAFNDAKGFKPDVVVIMLGTNDTKPQNWKHFKKDFEADYKDMVKQFAETPGKPRIFVCYPPYVAKNGNWGINEPNVLEEIPVINKVAKDMKLGVVDVHGALKGKDELIPDNVHPNAEGAKVIAATVFKALTGKEAPTEAGNKGKGKGK